MRNETNSTLKTIQLAPPPPRPSLRFRLHFEKESKEEVEKRKKMAREKILQPVSDKELEMDMSDIYPTEKGLAFSDCNAFNIPVFKISESKEQSRLVEWVMA